MAGPAPDHAWTPEADKALDAVLVDKPDPVDNPAHYGGRDNPYEVHKVQVDRHGIEKMAIYFQLTAEVYLARAGKKDDHVRDLRKAAWYANAAADAIEHGKYRP